MRKCQSAIVFLIQQNADVLGRPGQSIVGGHGQNQGPGVAQMGLGGQGNSGVGDSVCQLAQRVAGAGADDQCVQQFPGADGFGGGEGVDEGLARDILHLTAEILGLAEAGVQTSGIFGKDDGHIPEAVLDGPEGLQGGIKCTERAAEGEADAADRIFHGHTPNSVIML